jgi:hypothetical protein
MFRYTIGLTISIFWTKVFTSSSLIGAMSLPIHNKYRTAVHSLGFTKTSSCQSIGDQPRVNSERPAIVLEHRVMYERDSNVKITDTQYLNSQDQSSDVLGQS